MWTPLRQEIEQIKKDLKIPDDLLKTVNINDWKKIEANIFRQFCKTKPGFNKNPAWISNCLKHETYSVGLNNFPFKEIEELLKEEQQIWFFVNETVNEKTKFWYYEGKVKPILEVINNSALIDEIYLASKKYEWLICFNHHDVFIISGEKMIEKLKTNLLLFSTETNIKKNC